MEELIEKVKDVQDRLFDMDDSDGPGLKPYDELEILSELPSYPSIILEKLDFPLSDSEEENNDNIEQEEKIEVKQQKSTKNAHVIDEIDDFSEIPPDPPINFAPSYAIPIKMKNFLIPDLTKYSTATILILKGKDFPPTRSGVRSSYVTFQFDQSLPVIQSPVCYNHEQDADYNGGFNIDISKVDINNALPIIEAYDIISNKHQELIGFNAIQFQHSRIVDNYLIVVENEWIQLFMPHCRKKAGSVLISLYLHNGECPAIPKQPTQEKAKQKSLSKTENNTNSQELKSKVSNNQENMNKSSNLSNKQINDSQEIINQSNKQENNQTITSNSSSLPVKGNISQPITHDSNQKHTNEVTFNNEQNNQIRLSEKKEFTSDNQTNSFLPKQKKKPSDFNIDSFLSNSFFYGYVDDDDENENEKLQIKSDFMFNVEDNELIDTLSLDVLHPFSWSKLAKRKRVLRWMDTDDLDFDRTEEAETQTEISTKSKYTQTGQKDKEVKFSKTVTFGNKANQDNDVDLSKSAPIKMPVFDNNNQDNEAGSDPEEKQKDSKKDYTYPRKSYNLDDVHYNLFNRDDEFIGYSDYGLFAHKLLDEL